MPGGRSGAVTGEVAAYLGQRPGDKGWDLGLIKHGLLMAKGMPGAALFL